MHYEWCLRFLALISNQCHPMSSRCRFVAITHSVQLPNMLACARSIFILCCASRDHYVFRAYMLHTVATCREVPDSILPGTQEREDPPGNRLTKAQAQQPSSLPAGAVAVYAFPRDRVFFWAASAPQPELARPSISSTAAVAVLRRVMWEMNMLSSFSLAANIKV